MLLFAGLTHHALVISLNQSKRPIAVPTPKHARLRQREDKVVCFRPKSGLNESRKKSCLRIFSGIGFDLLGASAGKAIERQAAELTQFAASVLLFTPVLKGKPGQAFLKLLLYLQKGSATELLVTYGEFYRSLAASGLPSWQDYVLEQILLAYDNPYAKALAKGKLAEAQALEAAVAYDLDVLQKLSLNETTLVSWIKEVSPGIPDAWPTAAMALPPKPIVSVNEDNGSPAVRQEHHPEEASPPIYLPSNDTPVPLATLYHLGGPLPPEGRVAWRAAIGAKWKWSEAVPQLRCIYSLHGWGLMSQYSTLLWRDGSFHAHDVKREYENPVRKNLGKTSVYISERAILQQNIDHFLRGLPGSHVLLLGDGRTCQSWMCWEGLMELGQDKGLRLVKVPAEEVGNIEKLGRALGEYPRVRFAVVVDPLGVDRDGDSEAYSSLVSVLGGFGQSGWPDNAIIILSAHSNPNNRDDGLTELSRFPGIRLQLPPLDEGEFLSTLSELMGCNDPNGQPVMHGALQYGYQQGFSLRSAYELALGEFTSGTSIFEIKEVDSDEDDSDDDDDT